MKFALIHYDVNRVMNEPGNKTVMKHFGLMPNIQLLYVAAILKKLEVDVLYIDIAGHRVSDIELIDKLKKYQPDIIGLSVFTSHFHYAKKYSKFLKSILPDTRIMLGGVHTSIFPVETLEYNDSVDYVCVGEAEMVLPEFIRRWKNGGSFDGLKGLVWRVGNSIKYEGPAELNMVPDSVPFPARYLVPNERYYNFISTRKNYTVFNSSKGCPFQCIFCEAAGTKWRPRSAENVVTEFEECYEKYNIREIDIFDSSFTINKKRVLDICNLIIKKGLNKKIIWDVRSRVDSINNEMLEALKEAGCYRIFYGIESGNKEVLEKLVKKSGLELISDVIKKTKKAGISTFGYFIIGCPGDTRETMRETINFSKKLPLDFAIFNALLPFPKTRLYENYYLPNSSKKFWEEYIKSPEEPDEFVGRPWIDISNEELNKTAHRAMLEFYFRPIQLFRTIKSIGSFDQLKRYISAGVDMLINYFKRNRK